MTTVAILGAGKIGGAFLSGLLRAGRPANTLSFSEKYAVRAEQLAAETGVRRVSVAEAAAADVVVVAVKPQDIAALLTELAAAFRPGTLVVSLAAGVPTSRYEEYLPTGAAVVRVMPNTPIVVGEAMSAISAGSHATPAHLALVAELLGAVGRVVEVPEGQQDAVTALSGSGPAYFFLVVEAVIEAGVALGLPRAVASELVVQTALGSARMLRTSGEHPALLREAVTSPGGTTIAALRQLEEHGLRAAFLAAVAAAAERSVQLGRSE